MINKPKDSEKKTIYSIYLATLYYGNSAVCALGGLSEEFGKLRKLGPIVQCNITGLK